MDLLAASPIKVYLNEGPKRLSDRYAELYSMLSGANVTWELCNLTHAKVALVLVDKDYLKDGIETCMELIERQIPIYGIDVGKENMAFHHCWELLGLGIKDIYSWSKRGYFLSWMAGRIKRKQIVDDILDEPRIKNHLVGSSTQWRSVLRQVVEIALFSKAPTLILGESGTGKELISRLIHDLDQRKEKAELILLDCSTLVPELFGSEFFGHEKGAYTNAVSMRDGAFALANGGTLFLDELGELSLPLQAALLRVIQEGTYKRVGGNLWKKTSFRLVAATNRPLGEAIQKGEFREDLFFRISTMTVRLPPLRDRRLDIPELANHFLKQLLPGDPPRIGHYLRQYLLTRSYPGNIRELRQLMQRLSYRYTGEGPLTIGHLPDSERDQAILDEKMWQTGGFESGVRQALAQGIGLKDIKRIAGNVALRIAVEDAGDHLPTAADKLGVSERLVQGWWKERG